MPDEIRDKLKPKAIELRRQGWTYREIAGSLDISISTCSLWLRDVTAPPRPGHEQERVAAMWKSRWEPTHIAREAGRQEVKLAACREAGELSERETLLAGALVYWCEGEKDKSYRRRERAPCLAPELLMLASSRVRIRA
ncbi:helix-turn-helix domain-containing protein [Actinomadura sp. KC06]|uniref:helix-turn-helix domain-containing protein n=1 Tax=Actinomadura sp. KC06 TaxID=2530369 RepID=UPI0014043B9B|nr:helix-turn-helix domain-containing protein [Actinomadura sp. KC06]